MNFIFPWAFAGLLSVPVIVAMYLLKQKYKEQIFSNVSLWKEAVALSLAQRPWQKLKRSLLMALQILLAVLLVAALAEPFVSGMATVENYVLVLDASFSMQAADEKPNRFEKAKESMKSVVQNAKPGAEIALVYGGTNPYLAMGFTRDKGKVLDKISGLQCTYGGMDKDGVANLLDMLSDKEPSVYLFTDRPGELPDVTDIIAGGQADNQAIANLSYAHNGDRYVALVKAVNYGVLEVTRGVALYVDGKLLDVQDVTLPPGQEADCYFDAIPLESYSLTAKFTDGGDVLAADDVAYAAITNVGKQRVLLVTEQNVFLENALSLMPNVELYKAAPDAANASGGYYLYIFGGCAPEVLPTDGHILLLNPPEKNPLVTVEGEKAVDSIRVDNHQLLTFISSLHFDIAKTKRFVLPDWADAILSAQDTPLIAAGEKNGQKVIVMGFDLHDTDLPLRKEFPIFIYNLAQWFIPSDIMENTKAAPGCAVNFNINPSAERVRVVAPSGRVEILAPPFPAPPFTDTDEPGLYTLEQTINTDTIYNRFAVNVGTAESNLRYPETGEQAATAARLRRGDRSFVPLILALALLTLCVEWWVYSRGN